MLPRDRISGDLPGFALDCQHQSRPEAEHSSDAALYLGRYQNLTLGSSRHQACRHIDVITKGTVCTTGDSAISTGAHRATTNANLDGLKEGQHLWKLDQLQRSLYGTTCVIFVSCGCAKTDIEIAALIADVELQEHAFVGQQHHLHAFNEGAEFFRSVLIFIIFDPPET